MEQILNSLPPFLAMCVILIYFVIQDRKSAKQEHENHKETLDAILETRKLLGSHDLSLVELQRRVSVLEKECAWCKASIEKLSNNGLTVR